jgi:hypothetical protein
MPGMNGKGPLGNGPLTGGQRGKCKQTGTAKPDNQPQAVPTDAVPGQGQGQGLGRGQGGAGRCGAGLGRRDGGGKGQGRGGNR